MLAAIDNLGRINEAYGFNIADEVIAAVATRIRSQMRGKDHLGRFSGNKFGIILNNCTPDDMLVAADRLLVGARDDVVQTSAGPVAVTVTIGGVTAPRYARNVAEVLARAQDALDSAKAKRRGSFQAYQPNPERDAQRKENVRATDEIIKALNERRMFLVYEPVVAIGSRQPAFYECLMRVRRDDGSLLAVNEVVPLAERLGLVRLLDHRVLELVLDELAAAPGLKASLNVSAASTVDPDWWASLGAALRANPGIAERLTVEITETTAIQDIDDTRGFVARVKDLGCRIAIDDFGAGYTSFRNLRKLGVDIVKIDGAFVQNLTALRRRPRLRADADRSGAAARPRDGRGMGAGRGVGRDPRRLGLRLHPGRAGRAGDARAAMGALTGAEGQFGLTRHGLARRLLVFLADADATHHPQSKIAKPGAHASSSSISRCPCCRGGRAASASLPSGA